MRRFLISFAVVFMFAATANGPVRANTQCATEANKYTSYAGVSDPTDAYNYGPRILRIRSGLALNPAYPTVPESGLQDPGLAGCEYNLESGLVNTNYLMPGAAVLQVIAISHPTDIDHYPPQGCLTFNGTPPGYPNVCSGTNTVQFRWTFHQANANENWFGFLSVPIAIPSGAHYVIASARLTADLSHSASAPNYVAGTYYVRYDSVA